MPAPGQRVIIFSTSAHGVIQSYVKKPFSMTVLTDDGETVTLTEGTDVGQEPVDEGNDGGA